jgi:hypothetical protein
VKFDPKSTGPSLALPFSFLICGYFAGAGSKLRRGFSLNSESREAKNEATEESQEGGEVEEGGAEGRGKEAAGASAQGSRAQDSEADAKGSEEDGQDQAKSSAEDCEAFGHQADSSKGRAEIGTQDGNTQNAST